MWCTAFLSLSSSVKKEKERKKAFWVGSPLVAFLILDEVLHVNSLFVQEKIGCVYNIYFRYLCQNFNVSWLIMRSKDHRWRVKWMTSELGFCVYQLALWLRNTIPGSIYVLTKVRRTLTDRQRIALFAKVPFFQFVLRQPPQEPCLRMRPCTHNSHTPTPRRTAFGCFREFAVGTAAAVQPIRTTTTVKESSNKKLKNAFFSLSVFTSLHFAVREHFLSATFGAPRERSERKERKKEGSLAFIHIYILSHIEYIHAFTSLYT